MLSALNTQSTLKQRVAKAILHAYAINAIDNCHSTIK